MKIKPRGRYVLAEPVKDESNTTKSGLILPDNTEKEQKAIGRVISAGSEVKDISKGMLIIHGAYAGERISLKEKSGQKEYILIYDDDIIAFYEE